MNLTDIRNEIDKIDDSLLELFMKRMNLAQKVSEYKKENNLGVKNRKREREIISRVTEKAGEFDVYASMLFNTLFDISSSYQTELLTKDGEFANYISTAITETGNLFPNKSTVACQGVEGAYSQIATDRLFPIANIMYMNSFESVFAAVESGLCRYGVLPLENSSNGTVGEVYDLMRNKDFHIVKSIKLRVAHNLMVKPGVKKEEIKEIISHPQAIGQCSTFLKSFEGVKITPCENTATAAKLVALSGDKSIAAIAAAHCADLYGLQIIDENIQNSDNNSTRFICISKKLEIYPGSNKISLMLSLPHKPGSLYTFIGQFSALGLNLLKLESRPIPNEDFSFMFYFDFEASVFDSKVVALLSTLENESRSFSFLGNYQEIQ